MTINSKKNEVSSDFENLVRNGIDFLEKAMSQLDSDPKYSVINFHTAVEIFVKAPLVHEHWSLVVDGNPNRQKYEAGDFQSVSFDEACTRLGQSLNKPLSRSAKAAFDRVRHHRNRMVHFYHTGIDGKQRDEIKLEQAHAWFELNRFITDSWSKAFSPFIQEFKRMEHGLIANNHYAQAKFEHLRPRIDGLITSGAVFRTCTKCGTDGCQVIEETEHLTSSRCMVCLDSDTVLQVTCPKCNDADQHIRPYSGFDCDNCGHSFSGEEKIFEFLDQSETRYTKDDLDSNTPANCDECQSYHSVCEFDDGYLCANCFAYFDSINHCGWCNDPMTGDAEDTYVTGCEFCDGYAGHHADD